MEGHPVSVVVLDRVSATYGAVEAVRGVSLRIAGGQRVALLGQNGAGKTTLLKMILGLTPIAAGTATVLGAPPGALNARNATGFLPENVAFHGALSGREQLRYLARLKSVAPHNADEMLERVGLSAAAERKIRTYSKGMRQRLGLAQALLGHPRLALLDEPTSGLDPISRHDFYDLIGELARAGGTVVISTHALTELSARVDRIAILSHGKLMANGDLATLRRAAHIPVRFTVTTAEETADGIAEQLGGRRLNRHSVELACRESEKIGTLARITALRPAIRDIEVTPPDLEAIYRHYAAPNGEDAQCPHS